MVQHVLDPGHIESNPNLNPADWAPSGPIPQKLREFGYCVDLQLLKPGDLVLVSSITPGLIASAIRRVQAQGGYGGQDARWEHAAVYIGSSAICEATRAGVSVSSMYDYMGSHLIRVRRNIALTSDQGWNLAVHALQQKGYRYGFSSILGLYLKSRIGFWHRQGKPVSFPKSSVYCSELYADAHVKICGVALGNLKSGEVTPASLSLESALSDIPLSWVKIQS